MSHFSWHVNLSATLSVSFSDFYHETENYTLISRAIYFQTPWMTLYYHKKSKPKRAPQKDPVLVEIWLLIMADSEHTNFMCGMIGTYYLHSDTPNTFLHICLMGTYQKKRHKNNQYWWRYCHFLLVNSEQDMLNSDRNQSHFLHSNMVDRCIYI